MIAFALPGFVLEIADGDITTEDTDAIVNAANTALWMGAGVAGAIKKRGGDAIEREAMAQGPVEPGQCVTTAAGRLVARHVIHAAVMGPDLETSAKLIDRATRNALAIAESRAFASIAIPTLGTGVGGFPVDACARIVITAAREHKAGSLRLIRFVLFGQPAYRAAAAIAGDLLGSPLDGPPDCPLST